MELLVKLFMVKSILAHLLENGREHTTLVALWGISTAEQSKIVVSVVLLLGIKI